MKEFLSNSLFFGMFISLIFYEIGLLIKKRWKLAILNPLLLSIIMVILFLRLAGLEYECYENSAKYLSYLLTPVTVCLAIPLYRQLEQLKKNYKAILIGIIAGIITSMVTVLLLCLLLRLDYEMYATMLPKSITSAIAMGVSEELGGIANITVASVVITGIFGGIIAETVFKIFKITEPVAKGLALGNSSHAMGTAKAMELGETEGAISGLAIAVAGLLTVVGAPIFSNFF